MTPMRINSFNTTIAQLKTRAKKHNIAIRKYERGEDSYILVDMATNAVVATYPLTKDQIEQWLDDLDDQQDDIVTRKVFKVNNPDDAPFVGIAEPF